MILNAIAGKLKRRSKDDFKGRRFEALLIIRAVSWYLRSPLSCRHIEEMLLERGFRIDHTTLNRWVLAYAQLIEKRLGHSANPVAPRSASMRLTPNMEIQWIPG